MLCDRCNADDLQSILRSPKRPLENAARLPFADFILWFPLEEDSNSLTCELCTILQHAARRIPEEDMKKHSNEFALYATPIGQLIAENIIGPASSRVEWHGKGEDALVVAPGLKLGPRLFYHNTIDWDSIIVETSSLGLHRVQKLVDESKIDYELLKRWHTRCSEKHTICQPEDTKAILIAGLKVIDCSANLVVTAPANVAYVALSYVWGREEAASSERAQLPPNIPLVIKDAITVTMKLGIRYLWVDRYCIVQNDSAHKMNQINQMDKIYSNAALTIVASGAPDPSYGLPGVSTRLRTPDILTRVQGLDLSFLREGQESIENSTWNTRAWTLQEAYLSRRILYFGSEEVSFVCREVLCSESLDMEFILNQGSSKPERSAAVPWRWSRGSNASITELITRYSRRELSKQEDALDALAGIFKNWKEAGRYRSMYWGIPIHSAAGSKPVHFFASGLFWYSLRDDDLEADSHIRRNGFPSWSWLSVLGRVEYMMSTRIPWGSPDVSGWDVSVQADDGQMLDLETFIASGGCDLPATDWCRRIQVQCFAFPLPISL
ncbi:hypothetical protein MKZ38_002750 [Zalerion maritima]|uniref:Heterokaryon incompatibility domain-containing protein n=1 Tax=Zalerion maritima TaxID=339359 RepID=A0AAD5RQ47_9PEZI|nr:hypothetical protein MKZ38_002750 [Zalerion maritima]